MPSVLSYRYLVRLCYRLCDSPEVEVLDPRLQKRKSKNPPHLYKGEKLCLYLPGTREWERGKLLSETIIPWTSEWLLNYEFWLVTGEWYGGGSHPRLN